ALFRLGILGVQHVLELCAHVAPQTGRVLVDRVTSSCHRVSPTLSTAARASHRAAASLGTEPSVARWPEANTHAPAHALVYCSHIYTHKESRPEEPRVGKEY